MLVVVIGIVGIVDSCGRKYLCCSLKKTKTRTWSVSGVEGQPGGSCLCRFPSQQRLPVLRSLGLSTQVLERVEAGQPARQVPPLRWVSAES